MSHTVKTNLLGAGETYTLLGFEWDDSFERVILNDNGDLYIEFKYYYDGCEPVHYRGCSGDGVWRSQRVLVAQGVESFCISNPSSEENKDVVDASSIHITFRDSTKTILNINESYAIRAIEAATGGSHWWSNRSHF